MFFRKGSGVATAAIGAASLFFLAGTAAATPVNASQTVTASQPTGNQLKSALLPASDLGHGYGVGVEVDSGKNLERTRLFNISSESCANLWATAGDFQGFGENAFASDIVSPKNFSGGTSNLQTLTQAIYQFSSSKSATSFFSAADSRFKSCHSTTISVKGQGSLHIKVSSQANVKVSGQRAFRVTAAETISGGGGFSLPLDKLVVVDGDYVYFLSSEVISGSSPSPSQASLAQKLIARRK